MKKLLMLILISIITGSLVGCKRIVVGGGAEVGGVHGSGSVSIPIPKK